MPPAERPSRASRGLGCPRRLERLLAAVALVEDGDPLARAVVAEAELVARPRHARDDVADTAPNHILLYGVAWRFRIVG